MSSIDLCKKCTKRKFDLKQGTVCSLTNEKPNFIDNCREFVKDESVKEYKGLGLRPNEQRAKVLLSLIWIVMVIEVISMLSSFMQYDLLQKVANGEVVSNEAASANDMREQFIGILYIIFYIISAVTFIMWFRRAYFNLHQVVSNLAYDEGWAAGCWFVPFVNLYRPYKIMKELYEETRNYLKANDVSSHTDLITKFLGVWWTLWVINGIIGRVVFKLSKNADTVTELLDVTILSIVSGIIGVVLSFVTLKVIKDYSKAEGLLTRIH